MCVRVCARSKGVKSKVPAKKDRHARDVACEGLTLEALPLSTAHCYSPRNYYEAIVTYRERRRAILVEISSERILIEELEHNVV